MESTQEKTGLGNYFVANYPPFSCWKPDYPCRGPCRPGFDRPRPARPLGLYLHIPFCRKRCKFCYFRVYTDKNARDVEVYSRRAGQGSRALRQDAARRRPAAQLRLLRRRHAFLSQRQPAARLDGPAQGDPAVGRGRGSDLRVRAGHVAAAQARSPARNGRHAAEPGRRELQRRRSWNSTAGRTSKKRSTAPTAGPASSASSRSTST